MEVQTYFLDITLSDDEADASPECSKRKREDEVDDDDELDSFKLVYETAMAKIGYKSNKRMHLDLLSENLSDDTFVPETPEVQVTPPPVWYTPTPSRRNDIVRTVSPIQETPAPMTIATFVQETPQNLNISRDMFSDSMQDLSPSIPETPIPATPQAAQTRRTVQFFAIFEEKII